MRKINFLMAVSGLAIAVLVSCNPKPAAEAAVAPATDSVPPAPTSARPVHWGYGGDEGPANWAGLSPAYAMCGEGKHQSPIDITSATAGGTATWSFNYASTSLRIAHTEHMEEIVDNGHTIQVTVAEGSTFTFGDKTYQLKQFHFHTPSEHTIDGQHAPMEMHLVHQAEDESLAVVGVLFKEGKTLNPNLAKIISHMPRTKGESKHLENVVLQISDHIPQQTEAYHYIGSLTTPPCSEDVQWLVLKAPMIVSADQIAAITAVIGPNNRPTQPLNDRGLSLDVLSPTVTK
jgi:carbonic anhydrase